MPTAPAEEKPLPDWPLTVVMMVVAALGAYILVFAQWGEVDSVRGGATTAVTDLPRAKVEHGSFLEPANFRDALDQVARRVPRDARVQLMRVDAGQVWTVLDVGGKQRVIHVVGNGVTDDEGGDASGAEVRLDSIDPYAPQRMLRGMNKRFGVTPERLDYFSLAGWNGTWGAYLKDGGHFGAQPNGRGVVKLG